VCVLLVACLTVRLFVCLSVIGEDVKEPSARTQRTDRHTRSARSSPGTVDTTNRDDDGDDNYCNYYIRRNFTKRCSM